MSLAALQSAYAALGNIFKTQLTPDFNALKQRVDGGAGYDQVSGEINQLRSEFDNAYSRVFEILQQARQLDPQPTDFIAQLENSINNNQSTNRAALGNLEIQARDNQTKLDEATAAKAATDAGDGATSAGTVVAETTTQPSATPDNPSTNAQQFTASDDDATDSELRTIATTQSSPPPTAATPVSRADGSTGDITAPTQPGAGAASDDGLDTGSSAVNDVQALVNKTDRAITPQPNVLDKLASYTYSISIYIMSPEDFARLLSTKQKYIPGYTLLMQSAGAPVSSGITPTPGVSDGPDFDVQGGGVSLTQGRNQFFPLDYYIDDVELKSVIPGKGTGAAHNVTEMRFKIVEPNGITLLDNLYKATKQYISQGGGASTSTANSNYAAQNYLMVIRFYGYGPDGLPVTRIEGQPPDPAGKTDANAVLEKFIPFQFTGIKFRVANKLTEYECTAVCPQNVIATGQGRGTIPYNIELTATTLQNLFNGNETYTTTQSAQDGRENQTNATAPDKANAAPSPTLTTGLTQALNKYQKELVDNGTYSVQDVYKIVISHPEIANASIVPPGLTDRQSKPSIAPNNAASAKLGDKQSVNNDAKTVSATAGMSIVQFLDLAVRSSDYIYKQQTKIKSKDARGNEIEIAQGGAAQRFAWYRIGVEAKPIKADPKRNDDAYEITYEIAPYRVSDIKSEYFPRGRFRGTQKRYSYWFTGENTAILNFEQDFNYLYYITVNSRQSPKVPSGTSNYQEVEKRLYSTNSPQSNQGIRGNVNEPSANAADYLYSPADQARVRLKIIGDPAWIAQGEIWSGVRSNKKTTDQNGDVFFDAFLSDGTINFDAGEALFEINFNKPVDYDLGSGLMKVTGSGVTNQTYIYKAVTVTNNFSRGQFTQELEGVLLVFPDEITSSPSGAQTDPGENPATVKTQTENAGTAPLSEAADRQRQVADVGEIPGVTVFGSSLATDPGVPSYTKDFSQAPEFVSNVNRNIADVGEIPGVTVFGSSLATDPGVPTATLPAQNQAPTSSGETVGPASAGAAAVRAQGGASGSAVGTVPSVQVFLKNGGISTVFTQGEIQSLFSQGLITAQERGQAAQALNIKQQAANSATTEAPAQRIVRDD